MATNGSIQHFVIPEAGNLPNNATLPVILYKGVAEFGDKEPEDVFEEMFARNNWGNGWRVESIYHFHHYHSDAHEVVAFARGKATLQIGGPDGPIIEVEAGDAAVIPAGVGHRRLDDEPGLSVVGAYPPEQSPDVCVLSAEDVQKARDEDADADGCIIRCFGDDERDAVRASIAATALPPADPLSGSDGPVMELWQKELAPA
jgi:uncharacterized protein YjlB